MNAPAAALFEAAGRIKERLRRFLWLEWANVVLWGLVGGYGYFCVPLLEPAFASFGAELPASTVVLLRVRPFFLIPFAAAVICAAHLIVRPREGLRGRRALWFGAGAALIAAYCILHAIFAPMFIGSLSDGRVIGINR